MSYTKGPWKAVDVSEAIVEKFNIEVHKDGLRSVICRLNDFECCAEHGGKGVEFNAQLIAAAPELLEALELCQIRIFMLDGSENAEYQAAAKAIAQAKGH